MVKMNRGVNKGRKRVRRTMAKKERAKQTFKRAYLSRSQAIRKLQISAASFERLCILKGIYPREPRKFDGSQGKDRTYYFSKDITWLLQEPILQKFREYGTFRKKLTRLRGRKMKTDAAKHEETNKPHFSLATVIKERYPTFADALRDLDDALTHIFLYAAMPPLVKSDTTIEDHQMLTSAMSDQCRQLRDQWVDYVTSSKSVRRAFISIKGIYYQASIKGETVTWQCPYEFTSKPPKDVVHRTLIHFLEFYLQLVRFVLFKLQKEQREQAKNEEELQGETAAAADAEDFPVDPAERKRAERLERHLSIFNGLTFYVSRECARMHMGVMIRAFGGTLTESADDKALTHYIIDRPALADGAACRPGVEYVQPQWLFDCCNAKGRLPVSEYWMGKQLPPHVSPFRVSISNDPDEVEALKRAVAEDRRILEQDVPDRVHEIRRMLDPSYAHQSATAEVHLSDDDSADDEDEDARQIAHDAAARAAMDEDDADQHDSDMAGDSDSERVKEHVERSKQSKRKLARQLAEGDNKLKGKERAAKMRSALAEQRAQRMQGTDEERRKRKLEMQQRKEEAEKELKVAVMDRKKQKLWKAMQFGIKNRKKEFAALEKKREAVRSGAAKVRKTKKGTGSGQGTVIDMS
eukprot:TRINITY_DN18418_c0_g1_i1.p1 TRINITY_DN18418_c0_g1~~TRINITY_DN18418_c0_g1_i1.p1  ORF type:complete len:670 (+),score=298.99 TRINITY_DN18418_c0_g1_i1:101-2011(+)